MQQQSREVFMKSFFETMFAGKHYKRNQWGGDYGTPQVNPPMSPSSFGGPNTPLDSPGLFSVNNIEVDHCSNLHGWQQQLVGMLG